MPAHLCPPSTRRSWRHGHAFMHSACECGEEQPSLKPTNGCRSKSVDVSMSPVALPVIPGPLGEAADGFFGRLRRDAAWFLGIQSALLKGKDGHPPSKFEGHDGGGGSVPALMSASFSGEIGCESHPPPPPLVEIRSMSTAASTFDSAPSPGAQGGVTWGDDSGACMLDEDERVESGAGHALFLLDEGSSSGKRLGAKEGNGTGCSGRAGTLPGSAREMEMEEIVAPGQCRELTGVECGDSEAGVAGLAPMDDVPLPSISLAQAASQPISLLPGKEELRVQSIGVQEPVYGVPGVAESEQLRWAASLRAESDAMLEGSMATTERRSLLDSAATGGDDRESGRTGGGVCGEVGSRGRTGDQSFSGKRRRDDLDTGEGTEVDGVSKDFRRRLMKCTVEDCDKGSRGMTGWCISHGGGKRCQVSDCGKAAEGRMAFCKGHGGGKRCSVGDCRKLADGRTGVCASHGGGRRCSFPDCQKSARGRSDTCIRHGGGKRCQVPGCTRSAESCTGRCISHGGGRRCQFPECTKGAQGSTPFCKGHGGGKRCEIPGCSKGAEGRTPLCKAHGGGKRCMFQGGGQCAKSVHGGTMFCIAHGGGKRCAVEACTKSARGRTSYCVRHGGGKRCLFPECAKSAQGRTDFCKAHGGGRRCEWLVGSGEACDKPVRSGKVNYCKLHAPLVTDEKVHGGGLSAIFGNPPVAAAPTAQVPLGAAPPQPSSEPGICPGLFSGLVGVQHPCHVAPPQDLPAAPLLPEMPAGNARPEEMAGGFGAGAQRQPMPRGAAPDLAALANSFSAMSSSSPVCRGTSMADVERNRVNQGLAMAGTPPHWALETGGLFPRDSTGISFLSMLEEEEANDGMDDFSGEEDDGDDDDDEDDDDEDELDAEESMGGGMLGGGFGVELGGEGQSVMRRGVGGEDEGGVGGGVGPLIPPMLLVPPCMQQERVFERQVQEDARLRAEKAWEEQRERWQESLDVPQAQAEAQGGRLGGRSRSQGMWEIPRAASGSGGGQGGGGGGGGWGHGGGSSGQFSLGELERRVHRGGLMPGSLPGARAQAPSATRMGGYSYPPMFVPGPGQWSGAMGSGGGGGSNLGMSFERAVGMGIGIAMASGMLPPGSESSLSAEIEAGLALGMQMRGMSQGRAFRRGSAVDAGASGGNPTGQSRDGDVRGERRGGAAQDRGLERDMDV